MGKKWRLTRNTLFFETTLPSSRILPKFWNFGTNLGRVWCTSLQIIHAELNAWAPKTSPIKRKKLFLLLSGWEMDDKLLSCRADKNLLNVDIFAYLEAWVDVSEGVPSELSFFPAEILKYDLFSPSHRKYWKLIIGKTKPLLFFPALWNSCIYLSRPSISSPATGKES